MSAESIKIVDLFAGIGGIKIDFEESGFKSVFSNDFDVLTGGFLCQPFSICS